jgi:hypothetical protein
VHVNFIKNLNYGRIALITGDYLINAFDEKHSVGGRLVVIENDVKLYVYDWEKKMKREEYRFRFYEEGIISHFLIFV